MAFLYVLKKQPEHLDLAVGITYFAYVTEPVANNEVLIYATYHEYKLIYDKVHAAAMSWYHLKSFVVRLFVDCFGNW